MTAPASKPDGLDREAVALLMDNTLNADWSVDSVGRTGAFVTSISKERFLDKLMHLVASERERADKLEATIERAVASAEKLIKLRRSVETDVLSAHQGRGNGCTQWMTEDDRDFRSDLREAFDKLTEAIAELRAALGLSSAEEG